jgi:hypothetical protein
VSDSVAEVRSLLAAAVEQLGSAMQFAGLARSRIVEAVAVLDGLGQQHSESVLPPELPKAVDELDRAVRLISGGATAVADIDARL